MSELIIKINDEEYKVIIKRKISTKNLYLRIKDDLNIYITCNTFYTDKMILKFIDEHINSICKAMNRLKKKKEKEDYFYYLGNRYDIIYTNQKGLVFGENKVFINENFNIVNWYKKEALVIFQEELDKMYKSFIYQIPYPTLTIRKMKTRWGVCNYKRCNITLNLELIKKDKVYLDYVIVHELSHLIHHNHSAAFWKCVEENFHDYKKIRKELRYDE